MELTLDQKRGLFEGAKVVYKIFKSNDFNYDATLAQLTVAVEKGNANNIKKLLDAAIILAKKGVIT